MTPDRPTKRSRSRFGALCTRFSSRHASDGETTPLTHKTTAAQGATIPSLDNSSHQVQTQEPSSAPSSGITLDISFERTAAVSAGSFASNNDSAHQSANDNQSGSASVAQDDATVSVSQELWDTALENLKASEEEPQIVKIIDNFIDKASGTPTDPTDEQDIVTRIKKEMEQEIDSRRHDGRTTRFIKSVVSSLNKFVSVGDVAVSFDPVHAALPWAAVRAVLVMITAGSDLRNRLIEGIAMVTSLFLTVKMYLRLYLVADLSIKSLPLDVLKSLKTAIVETYTGSMQFLGYAVRQQQHKTRHLKAPMQLDTVADHLASLNRLGQRLRQAGDDCEKFCSFKDRETAQGLLRTVTDLQKALQGSFDMIVSAHEHSLLSKLPTAGAAFNHLNDQANVKCHPQTRKQLLKQIHDWIDEPQGIRTFWLVGLAGTGKSTISRTIAQQRDDNCLGASFFFKRGISEQDNGRQFFTTIAHQLAYREPLLRQQICDKIQNEPGLVHSELGIQFERLICEPLRNLEKEKPLVRFAVVIDALDECADRHHAESIIRLLTNTGLKCLKVFLTSRPEYDIRSYFACSAGDHLDLVLHQIDNNVIEHDIRVVLESGLSKFRHGYNKFHRDKDAQLPEDWPGHQKLQDLVTMCTPLFISVATFFRLLEMHPWPATPDYKVNFILRHSAPSDYACLYIPVLSQMLLGPQMDQERVKENFKSIVGPIVLLANPLSATSLSRLLGIDKEVVGCQLDCLSSVLDVPGIEAPVRLFHLSFSDFLVHADAGEFQIDEARVHQELSTRCLAVLSSHLKRDICDVDSLGKDREDLSQELIASHLPSELQYACLYWIYHFKAGGSKMKDGGSVHRFLSTHFLNWLEALSLLDRVYETTRLLNNLQDCIDAVDGLQLTEFVQDAKRFVLASNSTISRFPLQAYNSALVFAPEASIVRKTFQSQLPLRPIFEPNWTSLLHTLDCHEGPLPCLAFSPHGLLASANETITIWDPASGKCMRTLDHQEEAWNVVFSATKNLLASISHTCGTGVFRIWDVTNGILLYTWRLHVPQISVVPPMAFSHDARQLYIVDMKGTAYVCDVETGHLLQKFTKLEGKPIGKEIPVALSAGGKWLAVGRYRDNLVQIAPSPFDPDAAPLRLNSHANEIEVIAFSSDEGVLVSVSPGGYFEAWRVPSGERLYAFQFPTRPVLTSDLAAYKDEKLAWKECLGTIIVDPKEPEKFRNVRDLVSCDGMISFSGDGKLLASYSWGSPSVLNVFDTDMAFKDVRISHTGEVREMIFTADPNTLLSRGPFDVILWDVPTGNHKQTIRFWDDSDSDSVANRTIKHQIGAVAVSKHAPLVAVGSCEGRVDIWNMKLGSCVRTLSTELPELLALSFTDSGNKLVSSSRRPRSETAIEIWDTDIGGRVEEPYRCKGLVQELAFSPNGKEVVIAERIEPRVSSIRLKEVHNISTGVNYGQVAMELRLTFSPDGRYIFGLSASRDKSELWSGYRWLTATGECVYKWRGGDDFHLDVRSMDMEIANYVVSNLQRPKGVTNGYYIDRDRRWLMKDGQRLLWLPFGYEVTCAAATESVIAIGFNGGRVMMLHEKAGISTEVEMS